MLKDNDFTFERFCSFSAFYDASYKVCRNVRWKDSTINFEENRIDTILRTMEDLEASKYYQMVFSCFSIIERGKQRDIRACHIDDRLVQNSLCSEILIPCLTPHFIYDNTATLKNKGIDFALTRAKRHLKEAQKQYSNKECFYGLRIDIKKYFDSIDHKSLCKMVDQYVLDQDIRDLVYYIIDTFSFTKTKDHYPQDGKDYYIVKKRKYKRINKRKFYKNTDYYEYNPKSLGLGSQTSQLMALLALNDIDHFVKEVLHIKYYGRYMDDLYLLHDDKEYLKLCEDQIAIKLKTIGLSLNTKKTTIVAIKPLENDKVNYPRKKQNRKNPFKYLKWNFYITKTGKIIQIPFKEKVFRQRRKLRKMYQLWLEKKITTEAILDSYRGWRAHISKGTTFYITQDMDNLFQSLFKGVELK